jgi:hypothetical protein
VVPSMIEKVDKTIDSVHRILTFLQRKRAFVTVAVVLAIPFLPIYYLGLNMNGRLLSEIVPNPFYVRNVSILLLVLEICLLVVWLVFRRVPRFEKDEIGILVAVKTDDERLKIKLRDDFVGNLRQELRAVSERVSIKVLSEYHCEKIYAKPEKPLFQRYHYLSRAKLIVFGLADTRSHMGQESYHLKLEESASHLPIPQRESEKLAAEMIQSFPRETLIATNNEFFGFKIASGLFGIASKYILGIACIYSRRIDLALQFHQALLEVPIEQQPNVPNVRRLLQKTPKLVADEAVLLARDEGISQKDLAKMKRYLDIAAQYEKSVGYYLLMGIYHFLAEHDVPAAKAAIDEAKRQSTNDYTWAYSMAFLLAYEGNLSEAYRTYHSAFRNGASPTAHLECELFIRGVLSREPEKFQLYYCLGLLYLFPHDDRDLAKQSFMEFKRRATADGLFLDQIPYVDGYLSKIEQNVRFG